MFSGNGNHSGIYTNDETILFEDKEKNLLGIEIKYIAIISVQLDDLLFTIGKDDVYTDYHKTGTLKYYQEHLSPTDFFTARREVLFNIHYMKNIDPHDRSVHMKEGTFFSFSKRDWVIFKNNYK